MRRVVVVILIALAISGCYTRFWDLRTEAQRQCDVENAWAPQYREAASSCDIGPDIGQYLPGGRNYTPSNTETILVRRVAPGVIDYEGLSGTVRVWQTP